MISYLLPIYNKSPVIQYVLSGSKRALQKKILDIDIEFVSTVQRGLSDTDEELVRRLIDQQLCSDEEGAEVLVTLGIQPLPALDITRGILRSFRVGSPVDAAIPAIVQLFRVREQRISNAHQSVNANTAHYVAYEESLIIDDAFGTSLLTADNAADTIDIASRFLPADLNQFRRLYVPGKLPDTSDGWILLVIDLSEHALWYIDPRKQPLSAMDDIKQIVTTIISARVEAFDAVWSCGEYVHSFFDALQNDFDGGLNVAISIYFLLRDCPLAFTQSDMQRFRRTFVYWLMREMLPL